MGDPVFLRVVNCVENYFPLRFNRTEMASFSPSALAHPPAIVNINSTALWGGGEETGREKLNFHIISLHLLLLKSCV